VIYLDSSAIVKLAHPEDESDELVAWLAAHSGRVIVTSKLAHAETVRALRRSDPAAIARIPSVLARLFSLPVDDRILELAAAHPDPLLRTLDAVHIATAQALGNPKLSFITYDRRLLTIAAAEGFEALAPGADHRSSHA
jgi:uncharacterized protein